MLPSTLSLPALSTVEGSNGRQKEEQLMSTATLIIVGVVMLVLLGTVAMMLQRSWGGSLDRAGMAPGSHYHSAADIPDAERAAIRALIDGGNKIAAIKRVRE